MSVKKILMLTAAAGLALGSVAASAGGPDHMPACDVHHFMDGVYVGGNLIRVTGNPRYDNSNNNAAAGNVNEGITGWGFGGEIGYIVNLSRTWSLGGNVFMNDINANVDTHTVQNTGNVSAQHDFGAVIEPGRNLAPNIRFFGRFGYDNTRLTIYRPSGQTGSKNLNGYLVGLGTELAVHSNLGVTVKYSYVNFDNTTVNNVKVNPSFNNVSLGLNWHFTM